MRSHHPHADRTAREFELNLDRIAATEGLDDELLRQCRDLLRRHGERAPSGRIRIGGPFREHLLVAKLAFEAGLLDRAYTRVEAALELAPDHEHTRRLLAAIHHRRGRLSDAIAIWQDLASRKSREHSALRQL